jgi:5-methylcytosine-specific restriction endonuclease McrA
MRRRAIIALVFVVAGAVLVESWHAAMNAAATGGRPWPWLWPATLEAFIAVLVLVYWDARSTHRKAPMARVLLALTTVVASAVQILDAPRSWLGWLTAGWTPVALLLSVEFAVWLLYGARARPDWPPPQPPVKEPEPVPDQPERTERVRLSAQVWNARSRAIEAGATVVDFTVDDWRAVLYEYSESCGYCGREDLPLNIDHRTPLSRGGQHVRSNVVPACDPCNLSKGNKTDEEWQEHKEIMARAAEAGTKVHRNGWTARGSGKVALDREDIARRVAANQSGRSIAIELGLSQRRYTQELLPMVREIKRERLVPSGNGDGP